MAVVIIIRLDISKKLSLSPIILNIASLQPSFFPEKASDISLIQLPCKKKNTFKTKWLIAYLEHSGVPKFLNSGTHFFKSCSIRIHLIELYNLLLLLHLPIDVARGHYVLSCAKKPELHVSP